MSRKKGKYQKVLKPDAKYGSTIIGKFINIIMCDGKKTVAQKIVYDMFDVISEKTKKDPLDIFDKGIKNISPELEIKGKRIGGANYQIPYEVRGSRKTTLAFRWLIEVARKGKGRSMANKLATEIIEASQGTGAAIKKKEDVHKMAEANKAFAHYA